MLVLFTKICIKSLEEIEKMVRVITQETYDEVVKENMEEFDMTPEEAVKEAIAQFEAQVWCFMSHYIIYRPYINSHLTLYPEI